MRDILEDVSKNLVPEMKDPTPPTTITASHWRRSDSSLCEYPYGYCFQGFEPYPRSKKLTALLLTEGNRFHIVQSLPNQEDDFNKLKQSMRKSGMLLHAGTNETMMQWASSA